MIVADAEYTFTLTRDQYDILLLTLGYATGVATRLGDHRLAHSFMRLANLINKDNPHWMPYDVPAEER